jgi:hypothetical protein
VTAELDHLAIAAAALTDGWDLLGGVLGLPGDRVALPGRDLYLPGRG